MWQVVTVFHDGEIELDKIFNDRAEAERRASQTANYYAMFGGLSMVLPRVIAQSKIENKSNKKRYQF